MRNAAIPAVLPVYKRIDVMFERGEGVWLESSDGRRFLDFGAGIAVTGLGHSHPHLVKALQEQAARVWHVSNLYRIQPLERLSDRLVANSFAETVFVCNSGAEAMEACIKMARRYHHGAGNPHKKRIITFEGSFHGRTMATISAAGGTRLTEGFEPLLEGFDHLPFGDHDALKQAITPETGAIMVEPIQGEGGIRPVPTQCLEGLRELCDEHDLLLIFDEVQCGTGRTGKLFAHEHSGVAPDILGVAKGLGNGMPIGACLATARAAGAMERGTHGSTFGGNPLATTVANAVLDVILADGFFDRVEASGERLISGLNELSRNHPAVIEEIRGQGLMLGLRVVPANTEFAAACMEQELLVVPAADNIVRLLPPLIIGDSEIDEGLRRLETVVKRFAS
ncbi:MAG: aspartate aminotransferase family protein [Geminicoccaceae bacterium]